MAQSENIKEFLVAIGYSTNESSLKKAKEGIADVTKAVLTLGTVIEAMGLAVAVAVERWAGSLENLYFVSRRTGESANQLTAYSRAMQDFGASADEAMGIAESFASFLRKPGRENFVAGLLGTVGLSAKDANGQLLDHAGLLKQVAKMLQLMTQQGRQYLGIQYADAMGINERGALMMGDPGFLEDLAQKEKMSKGLNAAAKAANDFGKAWRNLKQEMQQMMLPFEVQALAELRKIMPYISQLMRDHGQEIVKDLSGLFKFFLDGTVKLIVFLAHHLKEWVVRLEALFLDLNLGFTLYIQPIFSTLYDWFLKLDKATDGWASKIAIVALGLKALGAGGIVTGLVSLTKGLVGVAGTIGGALLTASEGAGALAVGATGMIGGAAVAAGGGLGYWLDKTFPNNPLAKMGEWIGGALADAKDYGDMAYRADQAMRRQDAYSDFMRSGGSGATVQNFHVTNDITVHGAADPHRVGGAIADATEDRLRRLQYNLVRDFSAVAR
jgi:hypothetical protein